MEPNLYPGWGYTPFAKSPFKPRPKPGQHRLSKSDQEKRKARKAREKSGRRAARR